MNIPENILSTLSDEQKKKLEAAQSSDELLSLAAEAGYELTPDQLEGYAGGGCWDCAEYTDPCPGDVCPGVYVPHGSCRGFEPACPNVN